jgi:hypothetical protein
MREQSVPTRNVDKGLFAKWKKKREGKKSTINRVVKFKSTIFGISRTWSTPLPAVPIPKDTAMRVRKNVFILNKEIRSEMRTVYGGHSYNVGCNGNVFEHMLPWIRRFRPFRHPGWPVLCFELGVLCSVRIEADNLPALKLFHISAQGIPDNPFPETIVQFAEMVDCSRRHWDLVHRDVDELQETAGCAIQRRLCRLRLSGSMHKCERSNFGIVKRQVLASRRGENDDRS